jgi:FMN phosphatase YigB (HAD superfamily)
VKALVVDLDGTLYDVSARLNACLAEAGATSTSSMTPEQRKAFNKCFYSDKYMDYDQVNKELLNKILTAAKNGWFVVLLTGRPANKMGEKTLEILRRDGVYFDLLIMRPPGDFRPEQEYKGDVLSALASKYQIVMIDDNPKTREVASRYGIAKAPEEAGMLEFDVVKNNKKEMPSFLVLQRAPVVVNGREVLGEEEPEEEGEARLVE